MYALQEGIRRDQPDFHQVPELRQQDSVQNHSPDSSQGKSDLSRLRVRSL